MTAVINGIVAVPIMVAMMVLVSRSNKSSLSLGLPGWLKLLGWFAAGLMAVAVGLLAWSSF